MKKHAWLIIPFLAALLVVLFISCNEDSLNTSDFVAGETFTDSNIRVLLIDTLTLETSTMKFDSIVTSESSRMLIGKYTDSIFGTIRSSSFLELLPSTYTIDPEAEYDSIAFYLKFDKYYYNDTLGSNTIHIKQLNERLKPKEGNDFYNTSNMAYSEDDLGSLTYSPRPLEADTLEIVLKDSIGIMLFEQFQDKSITNLDEFREYFKGITIQPDEEDNGSIIGFSKASEASFMRLYFSTSEEDDRVQDFIDFAINTASSPIPFFNRITAEEPIDYLNGLVNEEINLSSAESGNRSFVQAGVGIATRIQIPYIKTLYDINGAGTILDAVLKIRPSINTYDDQLILRDSLTVFVVDKNNDLLSQLFIADIAPVTAILNRDNEEFNDIYYEITLGSYTEKLLLAESDTDEALLLFPENFNATVDRFILHGSNDSEFQTILELTYAIYDEDE